MNFDLIYKGIVPLMASLFLAVLFIQSGLDKVVDRKGNLDWLTGHFSKTFVAGTVPLMLSVLTVMELAAGLMSAVGIVYYLATGSLSVIFFAAVLSSLTLTALFFGQRIAKDYAGAAVLVPYFILSTALVYLTSPAMQK